MKPNDERRAGVVGTTGVEGPGDARRACRVVPARSRCLCPPLLCVRSVKNGGIPGASYGNASVGPSTRPVNRVQLLLTGGSVSVTSTRVMCTTRAGRAHAGSRAKRRRISCAVVFADHSVVYELGSGIPTSLLPCYTLRRAHSRARGMRSFTIRL